MTNEEALIKGCEALVKDTAKTDHTEGVAPWLIDRIVDDWYERAPLFPGDEAGTLWRDHPWLFSRRRKP